MSEWMLRSVAIVQAEAAFPGTSIERALADAVQTGLIRKRPPRDIFRAELDYVPVIGPGQNYPGLSEEPEYISNSDFSSWLELLGASADRHGNGKLPTIGRKAIDRSYAKQDAPLLDEMREIIAAGQEKSASAAALRFVDEAIGGGTAVSKQRRLERAYHKKYGAT